MEECRHANSVRGHDTNERMVDARLDREYMACSCESGRNVTISCKRALVSCPMAALVASGNVLTERRLPAAHHHPANANG